ncbi:MAG: HupE/UreJ family protein [Piscinibacter sp.]|nr:HupE/UreJ family protein [Piscinibacter sp.]
MIRKTFLRAAGAATLLLAAGAAAAHPGHGAVGLAEGLVHPLGIDHLLAMVAVGLWSAAALPPGRQALGPLAFIAAMSVGAVLAFAGLSLPFVEAGVAASVLACGALLAFNRRVPAGAGLALIALAATLHGFAHGAELPAGAGAAGYALGFLAGTATLHAGGLAAGLALRARGPRLWQALGALFGIAGLMLLARL